MINKLSRRLFLRNTAMATTGMAIVSASSGLHALSNAESPFEGYNPYTECKTDLRTSFLTEKSISVEGTLYNSSGNLPISNAKIEVWHLSPGSTKYRHRGKMYTDSNGRYKFISDWPNREPGKLHRIYFKVSKKETEFFTELLFNNFGAHISSKHWESQNVLGETKLFPKMNTGLNTSKIEFNLSLNTNQLKF
ncbi:hypothetical protein H7U19_08055 [Hyunsoonleella sp. SJ7]|uniref:Intradiol ring-cleavage dioxygenases domain-containing protein n=1 Tax=Hyunsoonleella aquatilis TaxID=2762758 RepID=A0A923HAU6_9FLAO|nr:hypothetical protein [Hyunsoonleella aquatilis]MBC3758352.1 hypothetical protein [Hyunsoonleella aquatilis]